MIEVEGLNVVFGGGRDSVHAVRDVSFTVEEGESFGILPALRRSGCVEVEGESGRGQGVLAHLPP